MKQKEEGAWLQQMAAYCSSAERCKQDILNKLKKSELSEEAIERILNRLVQEKYLDEQRYARAFVHDKLRFNKWGRIRISYELQKKNIPGDIRAQVMEEIDPEEYREILTTLLADKKRKTKGKDSRDIYYKLMRFAAGRGFESNPIRQCLTLILKDSYDEDME